MDFKTEGARLLFLKYALPCAETLVKRGNASEDTVDKAISNASLGTIRGHPERMFKTANAMCEGIAKKMGKRLVDERVIRRYFNLEHDKAIELRYKKFGDFDPMSCRVFPGRVTKTGRSALIRTPLGAKRYRSDFVTNLKVGDLVVVHRGFAVERISGETFKRLWKSKTYSIPKANSE